MTPLADEQVRREGDVFGALGLEIVLVALLIARVIRPHTWQHGVASTLVTLVTLFLVVGLPRKRWF